MFERQQTATLASRMRESRQFIQMLVGPRQVGKTTSLQQVFDKLNLPSHYATADAAMLRSAVWLEEQWAIARGLHADGGQPVLLAIDEVQKIGDWSERVKRLWDEDTFAGRDIRVVMTGSSPLLMQKGLSESLAGRFEIIHYTHWVWPECRDAFGWNLDTFIFYGGYPGSASLVNDFDRWRSYILDSIIETTVSRDILLMSRIEKPALLRRLFSLACEYAGRELSFEKMVGALQDAGNTTTVATYLDLLDAAELVTGLQKYAGDAARRRRSTPKLAVHNTALIAAITGRSFEQTRQDSEAWGHLVDAAVGANLLARTRASHVPVHYWRMKKGGVDMEVDYVVELDDCIRAVEVKSVLTSGGLVGLESFREAFGSRVRTELVGPGGTSLEDFLSSSL
ncbi:MAG: AAA family ATPase [Coriobacteriia bacterium]|nr:AAA family ATPase [Coriobacteriia bacterium]